MGYNKAISMVSEKDSETFTIINPPLQKSVWKWVTPTKYEKVKDLTAMESREKWGKLWYRVPFTNRVRTNTGYWLDWEIKHGSVHWTLIGWSPVRMILKLTE